MTMTPTTIPAPAIPTPTGSASLADNLRETNARLAFWLDSLTDDSAPAAPPRAAHPRQMAGLLAELMRAGHWLRSLPREKDAELELELSTYRKLVERLHAMLPAIHQALVEERARLEQARSRVQSAAEWMRRSRETL